MWMHHTTDKIPEKNEKKYLWQKKHLENKTGFEDAYKPVKIKKIKLKSMKLGNKEIILLFFFFNFKNLPLWLRKKFPTSPLINLNELKPSFEEIEIKNK